MAFLFKEFNANINDLNGVISFAESVMNDADIPLKDQIKINIALEELFVNIASYAYPESSNGSATIGIECSEGTVRVCLMDSGIPFDPVSREDPDVDIPAEERKIGGLGIYIVKKSMDQFEYRFENDQNITVFAKEIGKLL